MEDTAENGSLVSEDKLNSTSVEEKCTENVVGPSSKRRHVSDEDSTFENSSHFEVFFLNYSTSLDLYP